MNDLALKQPREGISGTRRDDGLLSLEDSAMPLRRALAAMAVHLHSATMMGHRAPRAERMFRRITDPQPGDLVVEWMVSQTRDDPRTLGILVECRKEWWHTDEEWAAMLADGEVDEDEPRMTDTAWYVQYGPNPEDVCRWTNCEFIFVPISPREFRE